MKNVIVDLASLGQAELIKQLNDKKLNILGVTLSCDVENYEDLCNFNLEAIRSASGVKVYKGAQRPLLCTDYIQGKKCVAVSTQHTFEEKHAVNFIIETVKNTPDAEIICLGPLSNVALAILKDEETMKKVSRIYVAGGALLGYQTTTPTAHHNILTDAEAAHTVFKLGVPVTLIPANVSDDLPKAAFDVVLGAKTQSWDAFVTIDTGLGFTRGQTVIDLVGRNPINGDVTPGVKQTVITEIAQ